MAVDGSRVERVKKVLRVIVMATFCYIWLSRNRIIYNSEALSPDMVVESIAINTFLWVKFRAMCVDVVLQNWVVVHFYNCVVLYSIVLVSVCVVLIKF